MACDVSRPSASLGDVSRSSRSFTSVAEVDSYLSLNVSSCLCLTAQLLQAFPPRPGAATTVVNVTSLYALEPCRSWVLYCTGKAAREMMFRVLAQEEPHVRVLSYSPGGRRRRSLLPLSRHKEFAFHLSSLFKNLLRVKPEINPWTTRGPSS